MASRRIPRGQGRRAARNQLPIQVMTHHRCVEHIGLGILRKIIKSMKEHNGTEPGLVEEGEQFRLVLKMKEERRS